MSRSAHQINFPMFVAHRFRGEASIGAERLRQVVREACAAAPEIPLADGARGIFDPYFLSDCYGEPLPAEVHEALNKAVLAIVDLTGLRPNVVYELGVLRGRATPLVLIRDGTVPFETPADLTDQLIGSYASEQELRAIIDRRLRQLADRIARAGTLPGMRGMNVWFPTDTEKAIAIICAPEPEKSKFASRQEANYLFIDNLEDRDALLETTAFLSRLCPLARVVRYASDHVPDDALDGDLVIIGGPGEPDGPGNAVARDVLSRLAWVSLAFSDECDRAFFQGQAYEPEFRTSGAVRRDYGYFLRARNPYNPSASIVLFCGVYTVGTLGAQQAFSDHPYGRLNALRVLRLTESEEPLQFEAFFPVDVSPGGLTICPSLDDSAIIKVR